MSSLTDFVTREAVVDEYNNVVLLVWAVDEWKKSKELEKENTEDSMQIRKFSDDKPFDIPNCQDLPEYFGFMFLLDSFGLPHVVFNTEKLDRISISLAVGVTGRYLGVGEDWELVR